MPRFGDFEQYFNNSGDILNAGKLYFYESGPTTTLKTTYADINQTTPNPNPLILTAAGRQGNVWFDGVAKVVLTTSADVILQTLDPVGDTDVNNQFSAWVPIFNYPMYSIVLYDGLFYVSLVNNNLGSIPDTSPTEWKLASDFLLESQTVVGAGEVAIGSATTGLTGVPVGPNGYVLTANDALPDGMEFAPVPDTARDLQTFTSSGTWTKPDDAQFVLVELWSGGGGGGSTTGVAAVGGGSGGEYVSRLFLASALAATVAVTIGAGGAGGAAGGANNGSVGGNTTFGALLTAVGGNAGRAAAQRATVPRSQLSADSYANTYFYSLSVYPQAGAGGIEGNPGINTILGGAGGGGAGGGGGASAGGTSAYGGNGGAGTDALNTAGGAGTAPSGGGGASSNSAASGGGGAGARGEARIWTW